MPYILDSLWRWGEFRANRLGSVEFDDPHNYVLRPAWQCGTFALFALMCLFAIFGPTSDALCALQGLGFRRPPSASSSASLLIVGAMLLFTRMLNAVTFYFMRRAESLATERRGAESRSDSPFANLAQAQEGTERRFNRVRVAIDRRAEENVGNLRRFFRALRNVQGKDKRALRIGLVVLSMGSLLVVAPIVATAYGFAFGETDPMSCARLDHPAMVVAQFVALLALLAGGFFLWRSMSMAHSFRTCLALTVLLVVVIGVLWLWFTPEHPSEATGGFYPHIYLLFIGALLAVALFARLLAHIMFSGFKAATAFRDALICEDLLHNERIPPDVSNLRLLSALINGVTSNPLHFFLLPSFVAFVAPTDWLWWLVPSFALVSIILLMYGSLSSRWEQMLVYVQRWFLVGTPLVMSLAVILLAMLRLLGVQYVSTVLDATPVGVLFIFIVMMYVAFWFFEYWVNRWLGEEMLEVLGADRKLSPACARCAFEPRWDAPWASVGRARGGAARHRPLRRAGLVRAQGSGAGRAAEGPRLHHLRLRRTVRRAGRQPGKGRGLRARHPPARAPVLHAGEHPAGRGGGGIVLLASQLVAAAGGRARWCAPAPSCPSR